jgi:ABC-type transport system involved in cytochrome c biogenesis permease subunit
VSANPPNQVPSPDSETKALLRWGLVIFFLLVLFCLIGYGIRGVIPPTDVREIDGYSPWSEEVVDAASAIPVQDGGRIKPLATFARFKMLTFHGSLTMKVKSGGTVHKIGPVEWLLDCMFRPELVDDLPVFRLDDSDILKPFGIETQERRARLSFNDIEDGGDSEEDGFQKLINRGRDLLKKIEKSGEDSLIPNEKKTVEFAQLVLNYTGIRDSFDILRGGLPELDPKQLAYVDEDILKMLEKVSDPSRFSYWMPVVDRVIASTRRLETPQAREFEYELNRQLAFAKYGPVVLPPQSKDEEEWHSLGNGLEKFLQGKLEEPTVMMQDFKTIEDLGKSAQKPNSDEFLKNLTEWKDDLRERAEARDEGGKVDSEVTYYERNYFMRALIWFIVAFVVSAIGWIVREGKGGQIVGWVTSILYVTAIAYLLAGIVHRFVITGRPPVSNLYDTIPFITAGAVIVLGISELLTRRRILLSIGAALGVIGLFFAFRFELGDAKDNMDPLRAVLDSNYWLATHVVSITIGYCGGLVACFLSMVYVFLALAGVMKDPKAFHRFMTRTVYGITCFTLLFSLVGTVLGGIWANDSWGRFWGWDPKENGALLIVLWSLIILHCRLAGWMKGWGIHLMSILGGSVVVFSWWGVNMLEVGLHSYGFIKGASTVYYFYFATLVAFFVGVVAWGIEKFQLKQSAKKPPSLPGV